MLLMPYYGPELSTGVSGRLWKGAEGVHYQRLQRFFRQTWMKSPPSVTFLNLPRLLSLERRQFGKCVFNLLVWGVLGVAIPCRPYRISGATPILPDGMQWFRPF